MYEKMERAEVAVSKMHPELAEEIKEAVKTVKADASLLGAYDARPRKQRDARGAMIRQFKTLHTKLSGENHHELARSLRTLMETYEQASRPQNPSSYFSCPSSGGSGKKTAGPVFMPPAVGPSRTWLPTN